MNNLRKFGLMAALCATAYLIYLDLICENKAVEILVPQYHAKYFPGD